MKPQYLQANSSTELENKRPTDEKLTQHWFRFWNGFGFNSVPAFWARNLASNGVKRHSTRDRASEAMSRLQSKRAALKDDRVETDSEEEVQPAASSASSVAPNLNKCLMRARMEYRLLDQGRKRLVLYAGHRTTYIKERPMEAHA